MNHFIFLLVASLLTGAIEVDISVPSFPDIANYFKISDSVTQMILALNFLGFCLSSIVYGPLSDAYGRRRIMLIGNAIMLVGAVGCMLGYSIEFLLLSRFIQGVGASTSAVVAFAMVADIYSSTDSARIVGKMNSLITIFMSIAPIAGGFINKFLGWRASYITVAIISIFSWLALYFGLPETSKKYSELSIKKVIVDFKILFSNRRFLLSSLIPSISFAGWISFVSCAPFLYMETYNLSTMCYVLHQGIIVSVFSIISLYSGQIIEFLGKRNCMVYGMIGALLGGISMFIVSITTENSPYLTSMSVMLYSTGAAVSYPVIFSESLEVFPDIRGTASSAIMSVRALICAAFIAVASYFYSGELIDVAMMLLIAASLIAIFSIMLLQLLVFAKKEKTS